MSDSKKENLFATLAARQNPPPTVQGDVQAPATEELPPALRDCPGPHRVEKRPWVEEETGVPEGEAGKPGVLPGQRLRPEDAPDGQWIKPSSISRGLTTAL